MTLTSATVDAFRWQGEQCALLGSHLCAGLMEAAIAGELGDLSGLMAPWAEASVGYHIKEATPIRLLGALHYLVLSGRAPELAAEYPAERAETRWSELKAAARAALVEHAETVAAFMTSPPQTNEVGRSLSLMPGLMEVTRLTGLPLRLFEIGSSAGLNLRMDRFGFPWGGGDFGVEIAGEWRGEALSPLLVRIVSRAGCDQRPVDVTEAEEALRLQAFVWADQRARLARLQAAIALARAVPAELEKADAAAWLEGRLGVENGTASVLFHSVMWQYMPTETQAACRATIERVGRSASAQAPFAWLRMEPNAAVEGFPMQLRLTLWPEGRERLLATVHPHGAWVEWTPEP